MPDAVGPTADRDQDVFVTSFDVRISYVHGRRPRVVRGGLWNVFLGRELIEHFEDLDDALELARKVSMKSRRPTWMSADGVNFEAIA